MYYAHSANASGNRQDLVEHLTNVAAYAREFAAPLGAAPLARLLGLCHDFGKFSPAFQDYLASCEATPTGQHRGPDHKAAGTQWVIDRHLAPLALLVQGHHGGLQDRAEMHRWLAEKTRDRAARDAITIAEAALADVGTQPMPSFPDYALGDAHAAECFLRLVFSALVDADYLDTERHFSPDTAAVRGATATMADLWMRFTQNRQAQTRQSVCSPTVAQARTEIYDACVAAAAGRPGFYRLTVPTGGGKTLSGMAFALQHAIAHGQRRVIVAVPFISITQQTAAVYRALFDDADEERPVVLEHHSAVAGRDDAAGDARPQAVWSRLAAENWDAPIVVTTTVQLFESLFANGTSKCRKIHRLANSVIILDEAQSLPPGLLQPILDVLAQLCRHYGTTVVLSTATQPAFEEIPTFGEIARDAPEIVPDPLRYFARLKRVVYDWRLDTPLPWSEVARLMDEQRQALTIVNTKRDALTLLDALDPVSGALHLSTLLCGKHRQRVIEAVKRRLAAGAPCLLVSTQVVEAGVDLDFPLVLRALGPLDSIIQAAGRCNRGGTLSHGRVIVFRPAEERLPPGVYTIATANTRTWLRQGERDPDNPADVRAYFRQVYGTLDTDAKGIQPLRATLAYPTVATQFTMIEDETASVVIREYGSDAERRRVAGLVTRLRNGAPNARVLLRILQPYTVAVRVRVSARYRDQGLITDILPGIGEWHGKYDPIAGLVGTDADPDRLVY